MPIYELDGKRPRIAASSYIHPTAVIIGDVTIGENCWIGPNATIRGDDHCIRIEDASDVQDNCVIHGETVLGPQAVAWATGPWCTGRCWGRGFWWR